MDPQNSHLDVYVGFVEALLRSDPAAPSSTKNLERDVATMKWRVKHEGLSFLTKSMPKLGKALELGLQDGRFHTPREFKSTRSGSRPEFLQVYFNLIFNENGVLLEDACPYAVRHIRQVCYALYKVEVPYTAEAESAVLERFVKDDADLHSSYAGDEDKLLETCSHIAETILTDFDPERIAPRHGPGAVATGERLDGKWAFARLYQAIHQVYPYYRYFIVGGGREVLDRVHWYRALERHESGVAKVVLVPKDSRGPRLISAEPLEYQWVQQGLNRELVDHLERHPLTRGHINFSNQEINRQLALESSKTQEYATLDLKDASDRVSLALVRAVFKRTPKLLRALEATRTTATRLPSGEVVPLKKFAPMGSALCFTIEAFCFYTLILAGLVRKYHMPLQQAKRGLYVYGDDIIIKSEWALDAIQFLERYDLVVNKQKSCIRGSFRESCGLDAFKGIEIQPLRMKKPWTGKPTDAVGLVAHVSLANRLGERGYNVASDYLWGKIETCFGRIPYGVKTSSFPCRWLPDPQRAVLLNRHLFRWRWNHGLQRVEFKVSMAKSRRRPSILDSWPRLLRSQTMPQEGDPSVLAIPRSLKIKRGWAAV